jgi:dienelactone hydrolase
MRLLESLLAAMTAAAAIFLLAGMSPRPPVLEAYLLALCALTITHLTAEGAHWQLAPLYAAEAGIVVMGGIDLATFAALGFGWRIPDAPLRSAGSLLLVLTLASLLLSWMLPMFRLPNPTGPHAVGTRILFMADAERDAWGGREPGGRRELMVQVWYPAEPVRGRREVYRRRAETTYKSSYQSVLKTQSLRGAPVLANSAPHPLLLFNPAWTGQRTQSTFLMQELASHGFVVASIDHTHYSGLVQFPDGRVFDSHRAPALGDFTHLTVEEGIELAGQFVRILAEDVVFVLDQLASLNGQADSAWHGRLDLNRVGALGHSIGGAAAAEACRLDARIKAALNLDGWTFGDVLKHGLNKPWRVIYGKGIEVEPRDLAAQPEGIQRYWQMNRENFAAVEAHLSRSGCRSLVIEGASHWNFGDRALYSPLRSRTQAGTINPGAAHRIISDETRKFFGEALSGEASQPQPAGNSRPNQSETDQS